MRADAGLFTQVVADPAQRAGQRIVGVDRLLRPGEIVITHLGHVPGYLLFERAGVDTGGLDAIEGAELPRGLGARGHEFRLHVVRVRADFFRVAAQVFERVVARDRNIPDGLDVVEEPQVAAGLEQIGTNRDGLHARLQQIRCVMAARTGRERHRQAAVELVGNFRGKVDGDGVQGTTGQVHRLLAGVEHRAPVLNLERVRELDAEFEAAVFCDRLQPAQHRNGIVECQIVLERDVRHDDVGELQVPVYDRLDTFGSQQRGIALHKRMQLPLPHQVFANALDFIRRATVHRRQRDVVRQAVGNIEVADGRVVSRDLLDHRPLRVGAVGDVVQEPLHVRPVYAREVVADAEVEDNVRIAGQSQLVMQSMNEDPGAHVFFEGLVDLEFL